MKKFFLSVGLILATTAMVSAQSFEKGTNVGSLNVGLGGSYGIPISLSYERGVYNFKNGDMAIGVGGLVGAGFKSENLMHAKYSYSHILIGARGAWHYTAFNKFDLYAGLTLGYDIASAKITYKDGFNSSNTSAAAGSDLLIGFHAGARYYFSDRFGVNAELGYGLGYLNIGVSYRF